MKILFLVFCIALGTIHVHAQRIHECMRLTLPLMQEFVHISWERPTNIKRTPYGVHVTCKSMEGTDTVIQLTEQEYERYILVVKKRMIVGQTDSLSIRALHDFVVWNNPVVHKDGNMVILTFPQMYNTKVQTKVPISEYKEFLDMQIKALEQKKAQLE